MSYSIGCRSILDKTRWEHWISSHPECQFIHRDKDLEDQIGLDLRSEIITPTSTALVSVSTVTPKTRYKTAALDVARSCAERRSSSARFFEAELSPRFTTSITYFQGRSFVCSRHSKTAYRGMCRRPTSSALANFWGEETYIETVSSARYLTACSSNQFIGFHSGVVITSNRVGGWAGQGYHGKDEQGELHGYE
jgi:hypothetical protein